MEVKFQTYTIENKIAEVEKLRKIAKQTEEHSVRLLERIEHRFKELGLDCERCLIFNPESCDYFSVVVTAVATTAKRKDILKLRCKLSFAFVLDESLSRRYNQIGLLELGEGDNNRWTFEFQFVEW